MIEEGDGMRRERPGRCWATVVLGLGVLGFPGGAGQGQPPSPNAESAKAAESRLQDMRDQLREAAKDFSPEQAYDVFKNLALGKTNHLSTKAIVQPRGAAVVAGRDVPTFSEIPKITQDFERIVGPRNFLPAAFLEAGAARQRAVGRVIFKAFHATPGGTFSPGEAWGTGFLVSPSLLMTNNHVIDSPQFAKSKVRVQFNFQSDLMGGVQPTDEYDLDPDSFFRTNEALDYTIVRVKPRTEPAPTPTDPLAVNRINPGQRWGQLRIETDALLFLPSGPGDPRQSLNIVQHPAGRMKEIAIHDNFIDKLTSDVVLYTTDTEGGSSGSPVFNSLWQVVALHHAGGEQVNGVWKNNEGIRMDRIARDLLDNLTPAQRAELGL
jgi:endonuclease G